MTVALYRAIIKRLKILNEERNEYKRFDFELPEELIAQTPLEQRDGL